MTDRIEQAPLPVDTPPGRRRRVYCRRCGRPLTVPASRLAGYGPDCRPNHAAPTPGAHEVEQDALPGT